MDQSLGGSKTALALYVARCAATDKPWGDFSTSASAADVAGVARAPAGKPWPRTGWRPSRAFAARNAWLLLVLATQVSAALAQDRAAAPNILTFTVIAAVVTTLGTLLGHVLKEIALARSFETWKQRRAADALYRKYRDPLVLSAIELANRLGEILDERPADFLQVPLVSPAPEPLTHAGRDEYYRRYKYQSTVYRLAAFLGWIELYRQELVFVEESQRPASQRLGSQLQEVRADLADGHIHDAPDWYLWRDALIFREEQRALGDAMIVTSEKTRTIMGYGAFLLALEASEAPTHRWIGVAVNFLAQAGMGERDFRLERYRRLLVHLAALAQANEPARVPQRLRERAKRYSALTADDLASPRLAVP
jgi:hypothetical protein